MKAIERSDIIVMNGAGLEDFMQDALVQSNAPVIDCSVGVALLPVFEEEEHHRHHTEKAWDPHIWMDPMRAVAMAENIGCGLCQMNPEYADIYRDNVSHISDVLTSFYHTLRETASCARTDAPLARWGLITFHDGFQYFADAFGFPLLKAIEEEEGAETSAAELKKITALIEEYDIPAIFTEEHGSDATARALKRETGCEVYPLDMLMSGDGSGLASYQDGIFQNVHTVLRALGEGENQ